MSDLRPRFTITKKRIRVSESKHDTKTADFTPDKVIYIELDDEITHVFDRVKRIRGKNIAIVIPRRASVLQSIVNLKILKKKIEELGKEIVIVTTDLPGLQLAEKAGIPAVEKLFEKSETLSREVPQPPLSRSRPMRIFGDKVSISEVIRSKKPSFIESIVNRIKERFKKKKSETHTTRLVFITPNKQALFTLILVSVLLFLAIAYIALPGATVEITPKSSILDPSFNITFLDFEKNRKIIEDKSSAGIVIASFPVKPPLITKKFTHRATGKIFKGENAHGTITIINLSNAPWELAPRTRFQTQEGLVFRTPAPVRVPAARGDTPGVLDVSVIADELDANGQVIGERGNISSSRFFLPGLKNEENRKKLYGESKNAMTGGLTKTIVTARTEDFAAAKEKIKQLIAAGATDDLKLYLDQENLGKKRNLSLLPDKNVIRISEPEISVPENLIGKEIGQFEVTAVYSVFGIAFDKQELKTALKERIISRVDPDKKIVAIDDNDISYRFLDSDESAGRVRLTASMRAIQVYDLDPEKENGHRFIKKITDHIAGVRVKEAERYLQQQTDEIARVKITTWPIWAPTIPQIADNIKFVIKEEENSLQ